MRRENFDTAVPRDAHSMRNCRTGAAVPGARGLSTRVHCQRAAAPRLVATRFDLSRLAACDRLAARGRQPARPERGCGVVRYLTRLPRDRQSPRRARSWIARAMSGALRSSQRDEELNDHVIWCVNELVTSALEECESGVTIKMSVDSDTLHVAVLDDGPPSAGADLAKDH